MKRLALAVLARPLLAVSARWMVQGVARKRLALAVLVVIALMAFALTRVDYGFYNPERGVVAEGRDDATADPHEREMLQLTITDADVRRFEGEPSLDRLSRFYGTDDSLRCSVSQTFKSRDLAVVKRPLRRGLVVTLCMN